MIKLVVTDMDGTLINHVTGISEKNLEAIHLLEKYHIDFAIASGRDYAGVSSVIHDFGLRCEAILGNGAQYVDQNGNLLMSCYMNKDIIQKVINTVEEHHIPYMMFTDKGFYTSQDPTYVRDMFVERCHRRFHRPKSDFDKGGSHEHTPCNQLQHIDDFESFLKKDINIIKIEAFTLDETNIPPLKEDLKRIPNISYLSSFSDNVEITDENAQKGYILEKVIQQKGLSKEEVVVLGDGMNDYTLFTCFPYSYAPANAEKEIKEKAFKIVSACEEDGFAEAIHHMLQHFGFSKF